MHVLGLEDVPVTLETEIADSMAARGRLGVVHAGEGGTSIDVRDGFEVHTPSSVTDALDILAPRCEFGLVLGMDVEWGATLIATDDSVEGALLDAPRDPDSVEGAEIVDRLVETEPYVTLESLVARIKRHSAEEQAGAIATFTGRVRAKEEPTDTSTEYLEFERYGDVAVEEMEGIRSELKQRDDVHEVLMHHRTGVLSAGADIVFVVVLAGHREQAFRTVQDGINRLKAEVPIFKKEVTVDEEFWVHNRP